MEPANFIEKIKENKIFFGIVLLNGLAILFYRISENYTLKVLFILLALLTLIVYSIFKFLIPNSRDI